MTVWRNPEPSSSGDLGKTTQVQELLDMDEDTISKQISHHFRQLRSLKNHPVDDDGRWSERNGPEQLTELHERLAFYRIICYQLSIGRKLGELDIAKLKEKYTPSMLYKKGYFQYCEDSLEWYFDPERFECAGFDDYRLVLSNNGLYMDWDQYHSNYDTYESDLAYVKYCEDLANETKWLEECCLHSSAPVADA